MNKLICFCLFFLTFCVSGQTLKDAFLQAGVNKTELKKVLKHYETTGEKEKYESAVFLIKNMPIHTSRDYIWINKDSLDTGYRELDYPDLETAINSFRQLRDSVQVKPLPRTYSDASFLSSKMIIDNIDLAYKTWKNNPWSNSYDFETFCEYILPYRSLTEPAQDWRLTYNLLLNSITSKINDPKDPLEVCMVAIKEPEGFSFLRERRPDPIPFLGPQHLLFRRRGTCPDLANAAIYAARSIGLAVTFDFTPNHAASSNRHFWNTIRNRDGKHIPFNGLLHKVFDPNSRRIGKVFRITYSIQKDAVAALADSASIPDQSFLQLPNIKDVTSEYTETGSFKYKLQQLPKNKFIFLNVFNNGEWKVTDWAEVNGEVVFDNLGKDVVYLPGFYKHQKMMHEPYPILLQENGKTRLLKPDITHTFSATLSRSNEKVYTHTEEHNPLELRAGEKYNLSYWDGQWRSIGISEMNAEGVAFHNIPSNALLTLTPIKKTGYERIFTLDPDTHQISWF